MTVIYHREEAHSYPAQPIEHHHSPLVLPHQDDKPSACSVETLNSSRLQSPSRKSSKNFVAVDHAEMEFIAAAASVTALLQISAVCIRSLTEITQRFRDAPEAIHQISRQISLLHSELNFIDGLQESASSEDLALLPDEVENLSGTLLTANSLIFDVLAACNKYNERSKTKNRVIWVFRDEGKMASIMSRLQDVRMSLQTILQIVNM
jgi:hypothetical protein